MSYESGLVLARRQQREYPPELRFALNNLVFFSFVLIVEMFFVFVHVNL